MFCGWQLANDLDELAKLNNGLLVIDVKTGKCSVNGQLTYKLHMPLVLNDWFLFDLKDNSLSLNEIDIAELTVRFNMYNFGDTKGKPPEFNCSSKLQSGDNTYNLEYKGEKACNKIIIT